MDVSDLEVKEVAVDTAKKTAKTTRGCAVWIINLVAMLAVVIILFFGVKWWLSSYTHHGEGIEVPNLYGMTHQTALHQLDSVGLLVVANDSSYVEGMPAGAIIQQNPGPGMMVKSGRIIYHKINSAQKVNHTVLLRLNDAIKDGNGKTEFTRFLDWNETTNGSGSVPITLTDIETKTGTKDYYVLVGNWSGQAFKEITLTLEEC